MLYRIGLNPDCPVHQVYAGAQCFSKHSETVTGYGSDTRRDRIDGAILEITEAQLKIVWEQAQHKVIRSTTGKRSRSQVYDTRTRHFKPREGDEPVAKYMYAQKVGKLQDPRAPVEYPTMAETHAPSPTEPSAAPERGRRRREATATAKG